MHTPAPRNTTVINFDDNGEGTITTVKSIIDDGILGHATVFNDGPLYQSINNITFDELNTLIESNFIMFTKYDNPFFINGRLLKRGDYIVNSSANGDIVYHFYDINDGKMHFNYFSKWITSPKHYSLYISTFSDAMKSHYMNIITVTDMQLRLKKTIENFRN